MFWIIILVFIVLVAFAIVIYTLPTDSSNGVKKKAKEAKAQLLAEAQAKEQASKDWKAIAERWERNNNALLGDIEKLKIQYKELEKKTADNKVHEKDLLDKLSQEKSWREKEQVNLDKSKLHEKELKDQIYRTEKDLEKEHSNRIRVEGQFTEIKIQFEALKEEKRTLSTKASSLETSLEQLNKELRELKQENAKLKEKREDIQWVAKTEHEELKKQLQSKEQEIIRLKNSNPGPS